MFISVALSLGFIKDKTNPTAEPVLWLVSDLSFYRITVARQFWILTKFLTNYVLKNNDSI